MSIAADESDNWRGSYDAWLTTDRREMDPHPVDHSPKRCWACGSLGCGCTPKEKDRAYRKRMGWELPDDGG